MNDATPVTESDLLKLVAGNVDFNDLRERLSAFNPFKVLRLTEYEIRHSNMLAWLFDIREAHAFDDLILKTFLFEVCKENSTLLDVGIAAKVYRVGLNDAQIIREQKIPGGFIDLLIISEQSELVLVVENKFRAKESKGQLERYLEYVKKTYPNERYDIVPVFLTLSGDEPSEEVKDQYAVFSYKKLVPVVESALQIKKKQMPQEMYRFVNYYLDVLKEELGMNEEVKKLCKLIYRDHHKVIDKIYDLGNDFDFESPVNSFVAKWGIDSKLCVVKDRWFSFVEEDMALANSKISYKWERSDYAVAFWFDFNTRENRIGLVFEVGPLNDAGKRKAFLELVDGKIEKAVRIKDGGQYTRLFSKYDKFEEWSSPEEILNKMNELYGRANEQKVKKQVIDAISEFDWLGTNEVTQND